MNKEINHDYLLLLEKFYKKLEGNIIRSEKKLENNSLLLTLIRTTSNKTSRLINDSSIKSGALNRRQLNYLTQKEYIREADEKNKLNEFILTAHGIWEIEKSLKHHDINMIIDYIQEKYFTFSALNKPLKDTERVILLSMIGARTFSMDSTMDLNNHSVRDHWLSIFNKSQEFLRNFGKTKKKDSLFEKKGNEHPVEYAMRRANDLPIKTQQIFCFKGNKQYYLDIVVDGGFSELRLKYLFKQIFESIESMTMIDEIKEFCESLAYDDSKYVKNDFMFVDYRIDEQIKKAITELYLE